MSAKQNVASVMDNLQNYCPTMSYSLPHESTQTSGQAPFLSTQYSCSSSLLLPLLLFLFLPEVYFYKACIFVKRVFSRCIYKGIFFRNAHIGGGGGGRPCGWWCSLGPHFFLLKTSEECFNSPLPTPHPFKNSDWRAPFSFKLDWHYQEDRKPEGQPQQFRANSDPFPSDQQRRSRCFCLYCIATPGIRLIGTISRQHLRSTARAGAFPPTMVATGHNHLLAQVSSSKASQTPGKTLLCRNTLQF